MRSFNLYIMALGFMVLFSAYNTLQNYATSLFPNGLGNQSLAVLYVVCAVSVFTAPAVVDQLGARLSMVVGAACYVAYMISLVHIIPVVVLTMSAVIGWGAAVLWVANGVYITMDSPPEEYAKATSTFWSIFQISGVVGNLCTYLVFPHLSSTSALYLGFAVVGGVGTVGLMCLGPAKGESVHASSRRSRARLGCKAQVAALAKGAWGAAKLLCQWQMLLICPLFFFSGYELAYWTGTFTQLLDPTVIGLVLTFAGVGEVAGAYIMGWTSDKLGRTVSLALGSSFFVVAIAVSAAIHSGLYVGPTIGGAPLGAYAAALGFGMGDCCFNTNAYAMCSQLHGNKSGAGSTSSGRGKTSSINSTGVGDDVEEGLLAGQAGDVDPTAGSGTSDPASAGVSSGTPVGSSLDGSSTDGSGSVGAFTIFQLLQNLGSALGFGLGLVWPLVDLTDANGNVTTHGSPNQVYLVTVLLIASVAAFAVVDSSERARVEREGERMEGGAS